MSIYCNRNDIESEFDSQHLSRYLDDNGDGTEDTGLFNQLAESVDNEILGVVASIPSDIATALQAYFRSVAKTLFCSLAFRRKGVANESNPFYAIEKGVRERLSEIQKGEVSFSKLKTFSYLLPARSNSKFSPQADRIESFSSALPSYSAPSGELVLSAPDGQQYKMVVSYSGGQVTHSWEAI